MHFGEPLLCWSPSASTGSTPSARSLVRRPNSCVCTEWSSHTPYKYSTAQRARVVSLSSHNQGRLITGPHISFWLLTQITSQQVSAKRVRRLLVCAGCASKHIQLECVEKVGVSTVGSSHGRPSVLRAAPLPPAHHLFKWAAGNFECRHQRVSSCCCPRLPHQ